MKPSSTGSEPGGESRWPPALALLAVFVVLNTLPGRVQIIPFWIGHVALLAVLATMAGVATTRGRLRWLRAERTLILVLATIWVGNTVAALGDMVGIVTVHPKGSNPFSLLSSAVAIWAANVLAFSLLFWQVDGGGPCAKASGAHRRPDWVFPQPPSPDDLPPGWRPQYVDYLFLAYNTATAFSPTDALPVTRRAKLLMTIESAISLVTLVVVVARAINALPA